MRYLTLVVVTISLMACAAKQTPTGFDLPTFETGELRHVLTVVEAWQLPTGKSSAQIEVNEFGESVTLEKVQGQYQIWVDFCGANEALHRTAFENVSQRNGLACTWYVGENWVGCREGYICKNGATSEALARHGQAILDEVFGLSGTAFVRYRYY